MRREGIHDACVDALLAELEAITRRAGSVALEERRALRTELKPDGSIVTTADRAVEVMLREELPKVAQNAGIWGEEFGNDGPGSNGLWTIDPIDGTSNFTFGLPMWGVGIAHVQDDGVELAAIFLPDLNEMYVMGRGRGAWLNGQRLPSVPPGKIEPFNLVAFDEGVLRAVDKVPGKMRVAGAAVVDGAWTAAQKFRGLVGVDERLYDVAPGMGLCTELEADVRYLSGKPIDYTALMNDNRIRDPWIAFPGNSEFFG